MEPVLHPQTRLKAQSYIKRPTHGVLLTGKTGSGKMYVATWLASKLGGECIIIEPEEGKAAITIDQIRELYKLTRSGRQMVIIIDGSHRLGTEAQNAFLKLLEEPPANTYFIITAKKADDLLHTVRSRTQHIEILAPPAADLQNVSTLSEEQARSLIHASEGLAGAFFTISSNPAALTAHQAKVDQAKRFYLGSSYERHLLCQAEKYDKQWAGDMLNILSIIIRALLKNNAENSHQRRKLTNQAQLVELTARNILHINGNPKIHLAKLCQQL